MTYAIETEHLQKNFGEKTAVSDLTLQVARGEVFGFLGPNGAGKTTSIKMLLGLVRPSGGKGKVLGLPLGAPESRRKVGFLPEHFRFHDWLNGREFLRLHADLYGMARTQQEQRIETLLARVGLAQHAHKKLRTYSKGMLQRIGLAQALLNRPELVFLDEPTSGLDPVGRRLVRDIIRELRAQGTAVFLNSHLLSEVEITCDRVAFIKHGRVLHIGTLKSLQAEQISVEIRAQHVSAAALGALRSLGSDLQHEGESIHLSIPTEETLPMIASTLVAHGAQVFAIQPRQRSLEELFLQIVGTDGGL